MASILDASIGIASEPNYGATTTPARFIEHTSEGMDFKPKRMQGAGTRAGSRVARSARRYTPTYEGGGSLEFEALSKGQGLIFKHLLGGATSSLVAAGQYQQVFTLADTLPSFTLQKGVARIADDASATIDAITFSGCMASGFELSGAQEALKVSVDIDAREVTTSTAYATPSYSANANLFHFAGASIYVGGALTEPTATALASLAGQPCAEVASWSLKVDRALYGERYLMGNAGKKSKPVCGAPTIGGSLEAEYRSTTFRDAFLADTSMTLLINYTAGTINGGVETLQVVVPAIRLEGELPKATAELAKMTCNFVGLDNLSATQPLWVITRTSDTAL